MAVASPWVKRIRHFGYPDKVRLVLETHQNYLSKYSAVPNDTGLAIQVGNASVAPKKTRRPKSDATPGTQQAKLEWEEVPDAVWNARMTARTRAFDLFIFAMSSTQRACRGFGSPRR